MSLTNLFFGVYPYIALTVFVIGSWIRYDNEQYTWKTDSSQLLSKQGMMLASNLFHVGIIMIFFGHFAGLVLPHGLWLGLGISDLAHQWIAIIAGVIFGIMCLVGGSMLWYRRMYNPRVRINSRRSDVFIITWLMATLILGLLTVPGTIAFLKWRKAATADPAFQPEAAEAARLRALTGVQTVVLIALLVCAAIMARWPF